MSQESNDKKKGFPVVITVVGVIIFILVIWFLVSIQTKQNDRVQQNEQNQLEELEEQADLNTVIATVNGVPIIQKSLNENIEQFTRVFAAQGADINDETIKNTIRGQAIGSLVNTEVAIQEAKKQGIEVTEEEVDERFNEVAEQSGGKENFLTQLESAGVPESRVRDDLMTEILVQELLESELKLEAVTVSAAEVQEEYDIFLEQNGDNELPAPEEEIRDRIEQGLISQKRQDKVAGYIEELVKTYEVEILGEGQ